MLSLSPRLRPATHHAPRPPLHHTSRPLPHAPMCMSRLRPPGWARSLSCQRPSRLFSRKHACHTFFLLFFSRSLLAPHTPLPLPSFAQPMWPGPLFVSTCNLPFVAPGGRTESTWTRCVRTRMVACAPPLFFCLARGGYWKNVHARPQVTPRPLAPCHPFARRTRRSASVATPQSWVSGHLASGTSLMLVARQHRPSRVWDSWDRWTGALWTRFVSLSSPLRRKEF